VYVLPGKDTETGRVKPIWFSPRYAGTSNQTPCMSLLKILFIVVLLIAFVPPVRRFVFYLLVGRQLVKEQRRQHQRTQPVREGETRVTATPGQPGNNRMKGGEYVDYEEVN
jgi:hypothetical protein